MSKHVQHKRRMLDQKIRKEWREFLTPKLKSLMEKKRLIIEDAEVLTDRERFVLDSINEDIRWMRSRGARS